jgi:alkylation response protein AidB-like acyl-CoA dehydrogenase
MELDLPSALEIIAAFARIEGSVGWTVAIASGGDLFAPLLSRTVYEQIYQSGPDAIMAGSVQPAGTAKCTDGEWRITGRWPFASGCQHADWMLGFCIVTEDGRPLAGEGETPPIRGFFLPAREWTIEDTWHVAGLRGTGSHHIALNDAPVPAANFIDLGSGTACVPGPLYGPVRQVLPLLLGAVSVGMAEGAVDELVALANTGRKQFRAPHPMRESEWFQSELGRVAAELRAARAFLQIQAENYWWHALTGTLGDEALVTQATQTSTWLACTCTGIADVCFALGGSSALYESSPLQRRLRDLRTAAQHANAQQRNYMSAGKLLLDGSSVNPMTTREGPVSPQSLVRPRVALCRGIRSGGRS